MFTYLCSPIVGTHDTRVVSAWDYGGDPSSIGPNSFVFWIFVLKCCFIQLFRVLCCRFSLLLFRLYIFRAFCVCMCRSLFLLFFVCCVCSILFVLLIVFVRLLVFFVVLSEIELSESKWFLLMKLELLFHSAVVRPFIRPSSYERFGRSPFSSSTFFCKTLLDHERKTCTSQAHWASSSLLARWKSYTRSAHTNNWKWTANRVREQYRNRKIASRQLREKLVNECGLKLNWEWETNYIDSDVYRGGW